MGTYIYKACEAPSGRYVCVCRTFQSPQAHPHSQGSIFKKKKKRLCRTEKIIDAKWCGDINKTEHYHWDKLFKGWGECDKFIVTMYNYKYSFVQSVVTLGRVDTGALHWIWGVRNINVVNEIG